MRVGVIANSFQEDYITELLNGLSDKGHEIDFFGSSIYKKELFDSRINFINIRASHNDHDGLLKKSYRIVNYYFNLLVYLFSNKIKVIHIQWLRFNFFEGIVFASFLRLSGKKIVYTAHDVLPHMEDNVINRLIFKYIYRIYHHLVVHTDFIKDRLIKEFKIKESKISVLKHGVYTVDDDKVTVEGARKKYGIQPGARVFLFFGIISKYKGINLLFKAFNEFISKNPQSYLIVAGDIAAAYSSEFTEIDKLFLHPNIIKRYLRVDNSEVPQLFKACDVVVLPYLEASQSGVLFMSYAYGKPVIAPNLGGFPKDVLVNKTGLLFEPQNYKSLLDSMQKFDSIYDTYFNSDVFIKEYSKENYSWDKTGKELIKVYESLIQ